ncbi:putative leucine-rich repeat-containing, plant-type, leucine-rich repeat domain, L [Rosa chinensis]|uniref:Putative leucine-rich repeat-containing, plant-type, leucine-rich repeat domain, L n=1 Tax=Rosa chinensis TaxID=74649 RepID=A0A2P6SFE8_ROSCH|nr:receptor like protein 22 [Rosa chinensis]PRQ57396.1 putative leucine-rich repeat-containing, plant-type, leucine-rich repeat domain, L [Rosa chinensis]
MGILQANIRMVSVLVVLLVHLLVIAESLQKQASCSDEESYALLQFKHSFFINIDASLHDGAHSKTSSWKPEGGNSSCCSWEGVECDEGTGHVIGLDLSSSLLFGSINSSSTLFRLVHLQRLNLSDNHFNYSQIPTNIRNFPRLRYLDLSGSVFFGQVPLEVSHLSKLSSLDLSDNFLNGPFSDSLANLTELTYLSLENNNFKGSTLSWVGKLTKLTQLRLEGTNLIGNIPSSLGNLTQLTFLALPYNQLTGPIPSSLRNLGSLAYLDLGVNKFHSSIPEPLFNLTDLKTLYLDENGLTGQVDIFKVQNMTVLQLGGNKLEVITDSRTIDATILPMFKTLGLGSCGIKEFPYFLRYQQNLQWLDLSRNTLHGQVPKWMWNTSTQSLGFLALSYNFLSGFGQPNVVLPWVNLQVLFVGHNLLGGSPPIPPKHIIYYSLDGNKLTGELSPLMCNLSTLQYLDLSSNKLSGTILPCLGNFSNDLQALNLRSNSLHGILPQTYSNTSNLKMLDVSYNQLLGKIPRSLANCVKLESLVLSVNKFSDVFPFWLGSLPQLKLLAMHHNEFYGVIENTKENLHFSELRILDLSCNKFRGEFPSEYIFSGNAMRGIVLSQPTYMEASSYLNIGHAQLFSYQFEVTISNKGVERYYENIQEDLGVIDISSNNFHGKIPEFIGNLKGLRFVNISNNIFNGSIPSFFKNLTLVEALDLSQNQLSGEIPQQLAQLTSLAYFNVSCNNLTGSIPQGHQFHTFENTSFEGNPGLCGDPLTKRCGDSNAPPHLPPSSSIEENVSGSAFEFDWKFVLAGFGSGLLVGVVLADVAITRRRELFLDIVGTMIRQMKRIRRQRMY